MSASEVPPAKLRHNEQLERHQQSLLLEPAPLVARSRKHLIADFNRRFTVKPAQPESASDQGCCRYPMKVGSIAQRRRIGLR